MVNAMTFVWYHKDIHAQKVHLILTFTKILILTFFFIIMLNIAQFVSSNLLCLVHIIIKTHFKNI
jgi:hypothetical protein